MSNRKDGIMFQSNKIKKLAVLAVLLGTGVALHTFEAIIPFNMMPGMKLGLANLITVVSIYLFGFSETILLAIMRVLIAGLLSGTFLSSSFILAFCGAVTSSLGMGFVINVFKGKISPYSVSVIGAVWHNVGQLCAFMILSKSINVVVYFPYLAITAILSGFLIGLCSKYCLKGIYISERYKRNKDISSFYGNNFHEYLKIKDGLIHKNEFICLGSAMIFSLLFFSLAAFNLFSDQERKGLKNETKIISIKITDGNEESFNFINLNDFLYEERQIIDVNGKIGVSKLEIDPENGVRFLESPCPDKLCIGFGWVCDDSDFAACLPNGIIVTVQ